MTLAAPGRVAAARALLGVEEGGHAEELLGQFAPPAGPDRAQAWFLALGVLRRRSEVDAALRPLLSAPLGGLDPGVRATLRLGAYERLAARTPVHAAVSQAVEVARALGWGRASGLVNAVIRKVEPASHLSRAEALCAPTWLVHRWDARYGPEATEAWCRKNLETAAIFAVSRDPREPLRRVPDGAGRVTELPGFREGEWWVADPGAVAVADLVPANGTVLDACAAPGGKAFRLASRGAEVFAVDRAADRLALVAEGATRLRLPVPIRRHDWREGGIDRIFDAVLVDAPCTGIGTIRRHPEIKWRRALPDLAEVSALQREILGRAARCVRPGGVLVYAVCSPEPEEGSEVIRTFRAENPEFAIDAVIGDALPEGDADAHWAVRLVREG